MNQAKVSLFFVALAAGLAIASAAGGIKGQRADESRAQGLKGLRPPSQQAQYLPSPVPAPQALRPVQQLPVKGPGQVQPSFSAARVQTFAAPARAVAQPQQVQQVAIQQQEAEPAEIQQQQQQVQEEVDPNAAAQDSAPSILAPAANAAASEEEANPRPEPYAFNYAFESGDQATSGSSQREEQQDASGKVTGFYTLKGEDGRDRRVDYVADASGFHATISTNEMGTAPKNSADVDWQAQSPTDGQLRSAESATQAARQRNLLNPQASNTGFSGSSSNSLSKVSSPRQNLAAASKINQQQQQQVAISQLQEPFEQIRQTELGSRARKSRHAPFYLFTV